MKVRARQFATAAVAGAVVAASLVAAQTASGAVPQALPRVVSPLPPTTTYAIVRSIPLGGSPQSLAVDSADDSVYVGTGGGSPMFLVIDGTTGVVDDTVNPVYMPYALGVNELTDKVYLAQIAANTGGQYRVFDARSGVMSVRTDLDGNHYGVGVNQADDTVYFTRDDSTIQRVLGATGNLDDTVGVGGNPVAVAVDQLDDTVYVVNRASATLSAFSGRAPSTVTPLSVAIGSNGQALAVNQADDTVYVVDYNGTLRIISGRTMLDDTTYVVGNRSQGVAVDQSDDTVYVGISQDPQFGPRVRIVDGRTGLMTDDSIAVPQPLQLAVDDTGSNAGLLYTGNFNGTVSVIGRVTPSLPQTTGAASAPVTIALDVPQASYDVDDTTVTAVYFDDSLGTALAAGSGDTWTVTGPAGSVGDQFDVTVVLDGGLRAYAGRFTYSNPTPPTPDPVYPPSEPRSVTAKAGQSSATVSWLAPASAGSFPVTDYEVSSTPSGGTCLVKTPALTCEVSSLTPGVSYTFRVRALNGASWGAASEPSNAVTPSAPVTKSIAITGSRDASDSRRVKIDGVTRGLAGATVTPYVRFPGQTGFSAGSGIRTVDAKGTFTWVRKTGKKVFVYFESGDVRSNTVIIPTR